MMMKMMKMEAFGSATAVQGGDGDGGAVAGNQPGKSVNLRVNVVSTWCSNNS